MKPHQGNTSGGESFDPKDLSEEKAEKSENPRPAPAPGLPVSEEEYKRLKESAKRVPTPRSDDAHEDSPNPDKGGK